MFLRFLALLSAGFILARAQAAQPLERAHAHNDYEHARPLVEALENGFCSVEADIYLVDGQLLVAHDLKDVRTNRTLQSLYLDPIQERVRANHGTVYPQGPAFTLLVDVKSEAKTTYLALERALEKYDSMLTRFESGAVKTNAVTVIVSGNRALDLMTARASRRSAYDGRLPDLDSPSASSLMPLVSDNWSLRFKWRGQGELPPEEKRLLLEYVQKAHGQGRRIRFWAAPDFPAGWEVLTESGVDLINTDRLVDLKKFLLKHQK